jgi:hypothetical protein
MTPLTAEKIEEMERLLDAATAGPWAANGCEVLPPNSCGTVECCGIAECHHGSRQEVAYANADLIAAAVNALPALLSLAKRAAGAPVCNWSQEDDESDCWVTSCGNAFSLNDGTPSDNSLKHCCYCGRHLTETRWEPEPDEDALVEIVGGEEGK